MTIKNEFRKALLERKLTAGGWMQIGHPACAEIFARTGFDWVCVDLEHGAIGLETMTSIFRALDAFGCVPVARLPLCDTIWIKRTLDAGARGLIIPMVDTAEQAEHAIQEAKYPPRGRRGYGYCRANLHGLDFKESIREANDEIAVVVQIEHAEGIANIDSILEVDGVDGAFIGPMDLSGSYGKPGDLGCPEMVSALETFRAACRKHNKSAGTHLVQLDERSIKEAVAQGYTQIALGLDVTLLASGAAAALELARGAASE